MAGEGEVTMRSISPGCRTSGTCFRASSLSIKKWRLLCRATSQPWRVPSKTSALDRRCIPAPALHCNPQTIEDRQLLGFFCGFQCTPRPQSSTIPSERCTAVYLLILLAVLRSPVISHFHRTTHPGNRIENERLHSVQVRIRRGVHGARGTTNENAKFGGVQV